MVLSLPAFCISSLPSFWLWDTGSVFGKSCHPLLAACRANYRLGEGNTSSHVSAELLAACAAQTGGGWTFLAKVFAIWADGVCITSCFFACSVKICLQLRTDDICGAQVGCSKRPKFCCLMHRPEKQSMLEILDCSYGTLEGHYELFLRKEKRTPNWNMQDVYHKDSWLHSFVWSWWVNISIWVDTSLICIVFDLWCAAVSFRETQKKLLQLCSKIYNIKFYVSAITCFRSCSR